jgi:diguanylate cyclase (GGDEF)-like protein
LVRARERTPEARELSRYLLMQQVVTDLLADLVRTPVESVDAAVDAALEVLGTFCAVDRVYVFAVDGEADTISNTHEWCAEGIAPEIHNLQDLPFDVIHAWRQPLTAGLPILVPDVDALPPERDVERVLLAEQGIRSLLVVPMVAGGQLTGFMGFDSVVGLRDFLPGEVMLLRSVADIVSSALVKARAERAARAIQQQLAYEATHDGLTGLANRQLLREHLARLCAGPDEVALLFIDVDRFKLVNDTLGHAAGDELLQRVAERLQAAAGPAVVGRFGGDEFVLLVERATPEAVDALVERVREALGEGVELRSGHHHITVSMGSACTWTSGRDGEALLRDADTAMYVAKDVGRNTAVAFDAAFREQAVRRGLVYRGLPQALLDDGIAVAYQPIHDLRRDEVVEVEALARWTDPALGTVPPVEFVAAAEELGLIHRLGERVLGRALADIRDTAVAVSVNLSPRQLTDPCLVGRVEAELERHGVSPVRLGFEVTESILVDQPATTRRVLTDLRRLGVRVALDDFGTGYSSLALLRDLPIDVLKVDRSFVAQLTAADRDRRFVRAIVALGRDLGMSVTAEGVETAAQLELLRELGCDRVQGFLLGRPGPLAVDRVRTAAVGGAASAG